MTGRAAVVGLAMLVVAIATATAARQSPLVEGPTIALWYRGVPAGVPRQDDLAAIRALGFTAIVWPADLPARLGDVRRMASVTDLDVEVRSGSRPMTPEGALTPPPIADISVAGVAPIFDALT